MMIKKQFADVEYFVWGGNPRLLVTSGLHGDEAETARLLEVLLKNNYQNLPEFVYIPFVSPTAVALGTRTNKWNRDVNRSFLIEPIDEEVVAIQKIVKDYRFDLVLDFHEDLDLEDKFYIYDNEGQMTSAQLDLIKKVVNESGCEMYEGYDDLQDPTLGLYIKDGYVATSGCAKKIANGFMSSWMIFTGVARRQIDFEVPGGATRAVKEKLVTGLLKLIQRGVIHR